jgi:anti-sigma regulatory factor (Ser/Thr protein kinase)
MAADYVVQLIVPAEPGSARLARLVAAAVAADASFTLDDTEDLRVAVSELVALLVEGAVNPEDTITLRYKRTPDQVEVTGTRPMQTPSEQPAPIDGAEPDDLALEILRVVVDEHHFERDAAGRHFQLSKRARVEV